MIIHSQVRLERPSHSSSSQDRFISKGLSEVEAELQDFDRIFDELLGLMLEGESDSVAVSSTHRSYSPAVEVSDSDYEKGDQKQKK